MRIEVVKGPLFFLRKQLESQLKILMHIFIRIGEHEIILI